MPGGVPARPERAYGHNLSIGISPDDAER
jgi:hypothetical protein